jgi:hypothetical protein
LLDVLLAGPAPRLVRAFSERERAPCRDRRRYEPAVRLNPEQPSRWPAHEGCGLVDTDHAELGRKFRYSRALLVGQPHRDYRDSSPQHRIVQQSSAGRAS